MTWSEDGLRILVAPADPDLVGRSLLRCAGQLADGLSTLAETDVTIDLGRLDPSSAAHPLGRAADLVVLVVRPEVADVAAAVHRARSLVDSGCRLGLVCRGHRPYPPDEVAAALELPLIGVVADSKRAADAFRWGVPPSRQLMRSLWWRSVCELSDAIQAMSPVEPVNR